MIALFERWFGPQAETGSLRRRLAFICYALMALVIVVAVAHYAAYLHIDHDEADGLLIAQSIGAHFCYCGNYIPVAVFPVAESTNGIPQYVAGIFFALTQSPDVAVIGTATIGALLLVIGLLAYEPWLVLATGLLLYSWLTLFVTSITFSGEIWAIALTLLGLVALSKSIASSDTLHGICSKAFFWACLSFGLAIEAKLITALTLIPLVFATTHQALKQNAATKAPSLPTLIRATVVTAISTIASLMIMAISISFSVAHSTGHWLDVGSMAGHVSGFISNMIYQGQVQGSHAFISWDQVVNFSSRTVVVLFFTGAAVLIMADWTYVFLVAITMILWLHYGAVERHMLIAMYFVIVLAARDAYTRLTVFAIAHGIPKPLAGVCTACSMLFLVAILNNFFGATFYGIPLAQAAESGYNHANVVETSVGIYAYSPRLIKAIRQQRYVATSGFWHFPAMALREHLRFYDRVAPSNAELPRRQVALLFDKGNTNWPVTTVQGNCGKIIDEDGPLVLCHAKLNAPLDYQPTE